MRFGDEVKSFHFGIYGQWFALLSILLCLVCGIITIFSFSFVIAFAVCSIVFSVLIPVLEFTALSKWIDYLRHAEKYHWRSLAYFLMSLTLWLSLILRTTSLIAPALTLMVASVLYLTAYLLGQDPISSSLITSSMKKATVAAVS